MDKITHRLFLPGESKEGKIEIPTGLTDKQIEQIWIQLGAIKTLVKAQMGIVESESE